MKSLTGQIFDEPHGVFCAAGAEENALHSNCPRIANLHCELTKNPEQRRSDLLQLARLKADSFILGQAFPPCVAAPGPQTCYRSVTPCSISGSAALRRRLCENSGYLNEKRKARMPQSTDELKGRVDQISAIFKSILDDNHVWTNLGQAKQQQLTTGI